jgi:uncharacterized protein DUF5655
MRATYTVSSILSTIVIPASQVEIAGCTQDRAGEHCRFVKNCHYNRSMAGRQCYHCKQWIEEGEKHDCWTTTEAALTQDLSEDLRDAWERLRATAVAFGDQRIYASHKSIMFSRNACYFFVRPKKSFLELCVFLSRTLKAPQVRRVDRASRSKVVHFIHIRHRDEVEAPITDWLQEAYELSGVLASKADTARRKSKQKWKSSRISFR